MKKQITLLFAVLLSFAVAPAATAQFSLGAGLAYGTDIEEPGIQIGGIYQLNEEIRLGADIIYWLVGSKSDYIEEFSFTFVEVNGSFNLHFFEKNDLLLYISGILGFHYNHTRIEFEFDNQSFNDSMVALGIGAGLEYNLGGAKLYAEPRFFLSGFDQLALAAGIRIPF